MAMHRCRPAEQGQGPLCWALSCIGPGSPGAAAGLTWEIALLCHRLMCLASLFDTLLPVCVLDATTSATEDLNL